MILFLGNFPTVAEKGQLSKRLRAFTILALKDPIRDAIEIGDIEWWSKILLLYSNVCSWKYV